MAERLHSQSPEHLHHKETAEVAGEQLKKLEKSPEKFDEKSQERAAEHARKQAELEAVFGKEQGSEHRSGGEPSGPRPTTVTKKQKKIEYDKTLQSVQAQLSKPARTFSKFIHSPSVEQASEVAGATIARPNAILAGSFTAFVAVIGVYAVAHYVGFRLSGFETIAAFAAGWIVGVIFDLLRVSFQRQRL